MKKIIMLATVACMALTGAALAADPPKGDPLKADRNGIYIGGALGNSTDDKSRIDTALVAGYQVMPYARVELDYDHSWRTKGTGNTLFANAIGQYRIPNSTITPYVLAGAGLGWDSFGDIKKHTTSTLYNFGAGVRIAVSESVELDARYRNLRPVTDKNVGSKETHLFSVGANYRF